MSRIRPLLAGLLLIMAQTAAVRAQEWKAQTAQLMTRWARDVSPANAHPEYPRPQMVRQRWLNLNGVWQFAAAEDGQTAPIGQTLQERILVPFPMESALSGIMRHAPRAWYRRTFDVPPAWAHQRVLLHFGAVDWEATVYVNGKNLGVHRGGYDAFSYDITDALKPVGPQEIVVGVYDPTDAGDQPRGKQVNRPGGIFYTPATGIWQTVWLEPVPQLSIASLHVVPDVDHQTLHLQVEVQGGSQAPLKVNAVALEGLRAVGKASGAPGADIVIPIRRPRLWSPSTPFLYDLQVSLQQGKQTVDSVNSYFGMRKIQMASDGKVNRLMLNGKFLFEVGPLDQGFWPDGIYTAPTDEALRYDIEMTKKLGFNVTRKHVKVEPDRWYYWCDRLGLLVWQDMPSGNNSSDAGKQQFQTELQRLIEGRRNHPSIIMWVVFNEGWGQHDTETLVPWVKKLDPSRLVDNASGWTDKKVGDVIDMHNYPGPGSPAPEPQRAAVLGEFGGLGLGIEGHTWAKTWGYRGTANSEQLTRDYMKLLRRAYELKDNPGLNAVIYTQITDVETEGNGLMTYDRAVTKVDVSRVAAANRGIFPPLPEVQAVVPTAQQKPINWRYTFDKPADDWAQPAFDDTGWKEGPAGFGTANTPGAVVRTTWNTPDIWIRRHFDWPPAVNLATENLELMVHHDEDVEIYINGVLAGSAPGYVSQYEEMPLTPAGLAALHAGQNTLAVHCHQTGGGQYVDVGIVRLVIRPPLGGNR